MDWKAQWIWLVPRDNMDNLYMLARQEFNVEKIPSEAVINITAGSLYRLYINGAYIGRGPNPTDPKRYYYDVYEVASHLKRGANTIAVEAYNYGPETRGVIGQNWGRGGLLVQVQAADDILLCTDDSWKVIQAPQWDQNAPLNCNLYGDFKEVQDTAKEPDAWKESGFNDSMWDLPDLLGLPPVEPYEELVEREIPFLNGPWVRPENAYWESASLTYSWQDDWEVYHEQNLASDSSSGNGQPAEIYKTHDDFDPSIILDFGKLVTGYPEISIKDSEGGVVDVLYGENLHMVRVDTFILKGGRQKLQPFNRRTFRYMKLLFRETPSKILIDDVSMKLNIYPVEKVGKFSSDEQLLNDIWETSKYTLRLSMLDHFVDCPWRERTIYGGDIYNENLFAQYGFGDSAMNRKVLRQMFAIQHPEGAVPPYGPYRGCHGFYASWAGFTGVAFIDHYWFHGDAEFLDELWEPFVKLCDWACSEIDRNEPHLMGDPEKGGKFDVWKEGKRIRFAPFNNAPVYRMLFDGSRLAGMIGRKAESEKWGEAAGMIKKAARETMMNPQGLWTSTDSGKQSDQGREYDAALYLWTGMGEHEEGVKAAEALKGEDVTSMGDPFGAFFLADGLFRYGRDEQAMEFIRAYWGGMLKRGAKTWWEHFSLDWPEQTVHPPLGASHCHGWGSAPLYVFIRWVLGISPAKPGFEEVRIEPHLVDLKQAEGVLPVPGGEVDIKWRHSGGELTCEIGVPAEAPVVLALPAREGSTRFIVDGKEEEGVLVNGRLEYRYVSSGDKKSVSCKI